MQKLYIIAIVILFVGSCYTEGKIHKIPPPCERGGMPNLYITNDEQAMLSWIEFLNDSTDVLAFATLEGGQWSAPTIIAQGTNWFVNWADFPSLVSYEQHSEYLAAHWLQKSAMGTYDYDVRIAQSLDRGKIWNPSFVIHKDGIEAEHGFVSLLPVGQGQVFATWLDGRYTKTENISDGHDHEGQKGAMTLRGAFFNKKGRVMNEIELDSRVCDCCATSAALTSNGVIVAYRDRSEEEIRDISIVRQVGLDWTRPRSVTKDNWEIAGCPVNGPKIIAAENEVALAWYTLANDTAKVQVQFSEDAGANFGAPIRVDKGKPLGRVGMVFWKGGVVVSWLEADDNEEATIQLAKVNPDLGIENRMTVTETSSSRSSGFPIIQRWNNQLLIAWTAVLDEEENTTVQTALIDF